MERGKERGREEERRKVEGEGKRRVEGKRREEGGGESEKNTYRDWSKISEGERVTDPAVLEVAKLD